MAVITFYESTPTDALQLSNMLQETDHHWDFIPETISLENLNPETEVLSIFVSSSVTREIIDRLPKLRVIATRSTGFDHIDLDAAAKKDITVLNVPTYGENTVAEHTFSLLLAITRRLIPTLQATAAGRFIASEHTGIDLKGRTIGIIGMGHIGQHVARISRGFDMKVLASDVNQNPELADKIGFTYESLEKVISESDILSLHAPLTPDNYHLINHHTVNRMKPGVIIINTARGELIENRALINGLKTGRISGAGLDTLEGEDYLSIDALTRAVTDHATSPLIYQQATECRIMDQLQNVLITKHSAFNTTEAIERINKTTAENIIQYWYGETPNKVRISQSSGQLVIVRHTESEWNAIGKWTGVTDVHITHKGRDDAINLGKELVDIPFNYAYTSQQIRTIETLENIMNGSGKVDLAHEPAKALNERDYGVYTGMNKDEIKEYIGDAAFDELRRSWDSPVEGGESLEQVYQRVLPFYLRIILPRLRHNQNILVVAHGNSIRSLIKYIENISDAEIGSQDMLQNQALIYQVDANGRSKNKQILDLK